MEKFIEIRGAKEHNLKNVNVDIPIGKISCIYGPSGSGKSSLAFHTLYAESKRRFLNSFPTYLKFFSDRPAPVQVESINPVLPVFGLPQNNPIAGTRACVADVMQVTDYLNNIFSNFSFEKCPKHNLQLEVKSVSDYFQSLEPDLLPENVIHFFILKDDFLEHFSGHALPSRSFKSKRSQKILDFDKDHEFWEISRIKYKSIKSLDNKLKAYLDNKIKLHYIIIQEPKNKKLMDLNYNPIKTCPECDYKAHYLNKYMFNPHNPIGACSKCNGFGATLEIDLEKIVDAKKSIKEGGVKILETKRFDGMINDFIKDAKKLGISLTKPIEEVGDGFWELLHAGGKEFIGVDKIIKYLERKKYKANVRIFLRSIQKEQKCEACQGSRIGKDAHNFCITKSFSPYRDYYLQTLSDLHKQLSNEKDFVISDPKVTKILNNLKYIVNMGMSIGLEHLVLNRKAKTLSAGEYQRLLLLKYLSYEGTGALFVFDEPSLGLSDNEIEKLFKGFQNLIDQGNTVLLVEHSNLIKTLVDYVVEMGPGPGHLGGKVMYTGKYNEKVRKFDFPKNISSGSGYIKVEKPSLYGKLYPDFSIKTNTINWVHGKSGSGKTSCMVNILANEIHYEIYSEYLKLVKGESKKITGKKLFDDVIIINSDISRYTSRSTVGSATDLISIVRKHFLNLSAAKSMGLKDGHLSTNSALGQCPKCEGKGVTIVEMQFLEDVILECEDCHGTGLKEIYANLSDGKMTVNEAYNMPIDQVIERIRLTPKYQKIYEYIKILNLSYLSLKRSITSLSGGEKQRIYLLSKLQKNIENSLIVLENISFGLSDFELFNLANFLKSLQETGNNTIIVIDQNKLFKSFCGHEILFS